VKAETVRRHGSAVGEICAVARERKPRLIVVGSHGWGAIGGALFGSVANGLLHAAPCPILVVPEPKAAEAHERVAAVQGERTR
jgi:nucleotide-binding universal stress UspA family protein